VIVLLLRRAGSKPAAPAITWLHDDTLEAEDQHKDTVSQSVSLFHTQSLLAPAASAVSLLSIGTTTLWDPWDASHSTFGLSLFCELDV